MKEFKISPELIETFYLKLKNEGEAAGYYLNPDEKFTKELVKGLLINEQRYGYPACPCRLASGIKEEDLDIICPCDYREADLNEFGTCYCGLYVSEEIVKGQKKVEKIPERRKPDWAEKDLNQSELTQKTADNKKIILKEGSTQKNLENQSWPIWRCRVCGYLCARDTPPLICPICKARQERFERFLGLTLI
ncbi:MAG: ferredoxin:glutaredoxin reductase [Candidatus Aminicenantes bacterium]|nr:ferredoxin:glutaredoxin reductase [Candidatus Aminicenantes bacterium]